MTAMVHVPLTASRKHHMRLFCRRSACGIARGTTAVSAQWRDRRGRREWFVRFQFGFGGFQRAVFCGSRQEAWDATQTIMRRLAR